MEFRNVGKRENRYDGLAHVTGTTRYVDDVLIPGMLAVRALRSPVMKGKVKGIDTKKAERTMGVSAVITAEDVPFNRFGPVDPDQPVLTREIRIKGELIAAVAAVDEDTALEAIAKIKFDIEEEKAVVDPLEAMKPGAAKVRPEGNLYMFGDKPYREIISGKIAAGFEEANEIIETNYIEPTFEHIALETQCSVCVPEANGRLTIYTGSQVPWQHIGILASILKVPENRIRYIAGTVGGAFGGKNNIHADHITALLASKTGKPIKWRWTREEELLYSTHRGAWHFHFKDGVKKNGRIVARQVRAIRDSGAYTSLNSIGVELGCLAATGPYFIPNVHIEGYLVYTNKPMSSSMRGFAINEATYVTEMQMNRLAEAIRMDPWEIRFINAYRDGDKMPVGIVLKSVAAIEVMKVLAEKAGVQLPDKLKAMTSVKREGEP